MNPTRRKAKKEHTCTLCAFPIHAGDEYIYEGITPWDHPLNDGYGVYKAHFRCDEVWHNMRYDDDPFPDPGEFRDWLEEPEEDV